METDSFHIADRVSTNTIEKKRGCCYGNLLHNLTKAIELTESNEAGALMKFLSTKIGAGIACAALLLGQAAWAAPVVPDYDTFGNLTKINGDIVDFTGTGIPTDPSVIRTFTVGNDTIRLGLIATPRFGSPAVGNDGAGTYFATTGANAPDRSKWNFSFFAESSSDLFLSGVNLYYDFDPAVGTDLADMGKIGPFISAEFQDSWNLGFGFLGTSAPGLTPPTFSSFDLNAPGEYSFRLEASNGMGVSMNVNVSPVPLPAGLPLLLGALGGLGIFSRRRRRS